MRVRLKLFIELKYEIFGQPSDFIFNMPASLAFGVSSQCWPKSLKAQK